MKNLLEKQKTVFISTVNENNFPHASYSPFVLEGDKMYFLLSEIAEHYKNLENNGKISVMITEDESNSKVLFARKRATFSGTAKKLDDAPQSVLDKFDENHGKDIMDKLKSMDFDFFEVQLEKGRLVQGFGQAYALNYMNREWQQEDAVVDAKGHSHRQK